MRIWAIANQKGGVGKTTTTLALGRGLAMLGHRVLMVDLDPHASLTRAFDVPADPAPSGVLDLFATPPADLSTLARDSGVERLGYVCAQTALATLERRSANQPGLGLALQQAMARHAGRHDYILLDCPPTLGLLMINALAAADRVIIPTQAEPLAMHGLASMVRTVDMVQRSRQRPLLPSILPTLFDKRTRIGNDTLRQMQETYGDLVWSDAIPIDTKICNAKALTLDVAAGGAPSRGLAAYGRALDWLIASDSVPLEQAA